MTANTSFQTTSTMRSKIHEKLVTGIVGERPVKVMFIPLKDALSFVKIKSESNGSYSKHIYHIQTEFGVNVYKMSDLGKSAECKSQLPHNTLVCNVLDLWHFIETGNSWFKAVLAQEIMKHYTIGKQNA